MATKRTSDLAACWGLLWRCFVFMPYMLAVFIVVGGIALFRWLLPLGVIARIIEAGYWSAAATLGIWFLCFWTYRHFRLSRFFEDPPSLL
jgi:hypothetical protein